MEKRTIEVSLATAKEWYKGDNSALKELALQAFTENELQKISCVKSWKEFCEKYSSKKYEYYIDSCCNIKYVISDCIYDRENTEDRNLLATKEDAEAFLALMQLKRLRDQWWEALEWKVNYTNDKIIKYAIMLVKDQVKIDFGYRVNNFLAFPTKEIAEEFLNCFRNLIEKAKELI